MKLEEFSGIFVTALPVHCFLTVLKKDQVIIISRGSSYNKLLEIHRSYIWYRSTDMNERTIALFHCCVLSKFSNIATCYCVCILSCDNKRQCSVPLHTDYCMCIIYVYIYYFFPCIRPPKGYFLPEAQTDFYLLNKFL